MGRDLRYSYHKSEAQGVDKCTRLLKTFSNFFADRSTHPLGHPLI